MTALWYSAQNAAPFERHFLSQVADALDFMPSQLRGHKLSSVIGECVYAVCINSYNHGNLTAALQPSRRLLITGMLSSVLSNAANFIKSLL